jgi:hypothetical protein
MNARFASCKPAVRRGPAPFYGHPDRSCKDTDTELFYSAADTDQAKARAICGRGERQCPFAANCFAYALAGGERHGVWAGVLFSSDAEVRQVVLSLGVLPQLVHSLWKLGLNDVEAAERLRLDVTTVRQARLQTGTPARLHRRKRTRQSIEAAAA